MIPPKLKIGQHIRIITNGGTNVTSGLVIDKAISALEAIGLKTSFCGHKSEDITAYINEINEAFLDPGIHGLLLADGIYEDDNFDQIDCDAIIANPKIIAGLAEASLLSIYLFYKTGLVNYYGPNLKMLGLSKTTEQCVAAMKEVLMINATIRLYPSSNYGIGNYQTKKNEIWIINEGMAEGQCMIGGNCFDNFSNIDVDYSLDYRDNIIVICGNQVHDIAELHRNLDLVLAKEGGKYISGLIIGGVEEEGITARQVNEAIKEKTPIAHIPVVANVNLVKSDPKFTLPIGGSLRVKIKRRNGVKIDIIEH